MTRRAASLPFVLRRSTDVIGRAITTTTDTTHGLLHLDGHRLVMQWRRARTTDQIGDEIRSDVEVGVVREVEVPITAVSGAFVRRRWWGRASLVLVAADLQAFDRIAGSEGLALEHPAELVIPLRRADRLLAEEFAAELALALAERQLSSGTDTTP